MIIKAPRRQQKKGPNRPACARLDIPGKRIILMNGAKVQQSSLDIPTKGEVRGWYEDFDSQWNSVGFTVIGAADAKKENPAFHFTWTK